MVARGQGAEWGRKWVDMDLKGNMRDLQGDETVLYFVSISRS